MDSDPYYSGLIGRVMDVMGSNMWDCFCGLKPMWPTFKCGGRTGTANRVTLGSKHFGRSKTRISIFLVSRCNFLFGLSLVGRIFDD